MEQIDMSAFVGRNFYCEFGGKYGFGNLRENRIGYLIGISVGIAPYQYASSYNSGSMHCRPHLNKPQVLDDWSWVPDGLVWEVRYWIDPNKQGEEPYLVTMSAMSSKRLRDLEQLDGVEWASCIGLEPGYEHPGMDVVEL